MQGQRQREDRSHSPPFRTSAKLRYVKSRLTGNAAGGNAYNVADMASLPQPCAMRERTTWSFSTPGVLERLLAVGSFGEQHPHADLLDSTGSLWAQLDDSRPWEYFSKVQACQEGFARIAGVLRLAG